MIKGKKKYNYKEVLAMIFLKKKIVKHCIDLILISLKNTKYW